MTMNHRLSCLASMLILAVCGCESDPIPPLAVASRQLLLDGAPVADAAAPDQPDPALPGSEEPDPEPPSDPGDGPPPDAPEQPTAAEPPVRAACSATPATTVLRIAEQLPSVNPSNESLLDYAAKCAKATGITIPSFDCTKGTEVPGQETDADCKCNTPNVLNQECDPGSRFQVLPGATSDAVAVAHCRKQGLQEKEYFTDIAVIAYNKVNGATCFFQALGDHLRGDSVPSPAVSQTATEFAWKTPDEAAAIGCTSCHDTGGFLRSPYLAQLNLLPSAAEGFDNKTTPVRYVGQAFADKRSWAVDAPAPACAEGNDCPRCNSCHRLAVNNFGMTTRGTATWLAQFATAAEQPSKRAHSADSPIFMRPGQNVYDPQAEAEAKSFQDCAIGFMNSGYLKAPPGCSVTPLAAPWTP